MQTGISLYLGNGLEVNERVIECAHRAHVSYAFTSLQIPEESGVGYERDVRHLLRLLDAANISLIADVGPDTCEKLGCSRIEELVEMGVTHLRLDYGFDPQQTAQLSRIFHIVCNASTVSAREVAAWRESGANLARFSACHNYYPKRWTGLDLVDVLRMNRRLAAYGFETIGFIPGNKTMRGPLFEGLPTVEEQRNQRDRVALNALELALDGECGIVIVGDVDLTDSGWDQLGQLARGFVDVDCTLESGYEYLRGQVHHDRVDSSPWVFRSPESRTTLRPERTLAPDAAAGAPRSAGSIAVSNSAYLRYEGELEIARRDLPGDARINVVGQVAEEDLDLLPYVREGFGLRFV